MKVNCKWSNLLFDFLYIKEFKIMIINIVYKQTKNCDIKRFEWEISRYGDTFIIDRHEDCDGMIHGSLMLAFG